MVLRGEGVVCENATLGKGGELQRVGFEPW